MKGGDNMNKEKLIEKTQALINKKGISRKELAKGLYKLTLESLTLEDLEKLDKETGALNVLIKVMDFI
jgi:hypothetical protein